MRLPRYRLLSGATLLTLSLGACEDFGPRVYTARAYIADLDCLERYAPLGLVEADELPVDCDPVCLEMDYQVYVSSVCPPYPMTAEMVSAAASPVCGAALGALEAERFCEAEEEAF